MWMKHFSKLDCFWNSSSNSFPLGWSLTWTKKKKKMWNSSLRNSSSICTELEFPKLKFSVKNIGTQVSETRVQYGFDLIPWWIWFCGMSLTWFLGQNLPNSSFLGKNLLHSMRMKHFSKLDYFWNSSSNPFPLRWSLTSTKKKKKVELESKKLKFHLYKTRVS